MQYSRPIYVTPRGTAVVCPYRARMLAEFEGQSVTLPMMPRRTSTPPTGTPAPAAQPDAAHGAPWAQGPGGWLDAELARATAHGRDV